MWVRRWVKEREREQIVEAGEIGVRESEVKE
jgi:hypothetical protein